MILEIIFTVTENMFDTSNDKYKNFVATMLKQLLRSFQSNQETNLEFHGKW